MMMQSRSARTGWLLPAILWAALPATGAVHVVQQIDFAFVPAQVTVAPGDTVRWVRTSGTHTVTSGSNCTYDGLYFDAPLGPGNTVFEFVIPNGVTEIPYFCRPHCPGMVGTIFVQEPLPLIDFIMSLDGYQEPGQVVTTGNGTGTATLDPNTNTLSWSISYAGLSGMPSAAHFHGPARPCINAGIQVTLSLATNPIVGSASLTATQVDQLLAGLWYVNIHTPLHPGGEIRGQVMPLPLADPLTATIQTGDITVGLRPVATGLTAPNWGTFAPGHTNRLYVSDQTGLVWAINLTSGNKSVFLDVSGLLVPLGVFGPGSFDERGLLGIAFHPDYQSNGRFYTYTSQPVSGPADFSTMPLAVAANHQSVITEWQVPSPGDPGAVVDPNSARELLRIDQPQFNHNAGALNFGPDGLLYVALGDGGGADDKDGQMSLGNPIVGHGCGGNGQDTSTILGSIVRIDPLGSNSANGQYGIPGDNPFVGGAGLDEIYAYGFRNPFRFSFDRLTGDLYVGDVGQNDIEEINIVTLGGNYGWRWMEGSLFFAFNGNQAGYVTDVPLDVPAGLLDPIAEYDHDDGTAIVGGFVYRGTALPELAGRYVFGEFAQTFSNDGRLFYLTAGNEIRELQLAGQAALGLSLLGFGEDAAGELYVLANATGTPAGSTGVVLRIAPAVCAGDSNCDGSVTWRDIDFFVAAMNDNVAAWQALFAPGLPTCTFANNDVNSDSTVSWRDIDPLVAVMNTVCP